RRQLSDSLSMKPRGPVPALTCRMYPARYGRPKNTCRSRWGWFPGWQFGAVAKIADLSGDFALSTGESAWSIRFGRTLNSCRESRRVEIEWRPIQQQPIFEAQNFGKGLLYHD